MYNPWFKSDAKYGLDFMKSFKPMKVNSIVKITGRYVLRCLTAIR